MALIQKFTMSIVAGKNGRNVYISQSVFLSRHVLSTYSLFAGVRPVFLLDIGKHVRDGLQPSFPREAIGSHIERRASGFRRRGTGGDRGGGHMQQVVRFSKPIEIDGFPIP